MPPSPKAALLALSYFYGIAPGVPGTAYEAAISGQLVADGATPEAAAAEIKWLDDCFASYVVTKKQRPSETK